MAVESTTGVYTRGGVGTGQWARFFRDDAVTQACLRGARLRQCGRVFSFMHKSIPEYFVACAVWSDVVAAVTAIASRASDFDAVDDGDSGARAVDVGGTVLNRIPLSTQPAVLAFVVDMFGKLPWDGSSESDGSRGRAGDGTSSSGSGSTNEVKSGSGDGGTSRGSDRGFGWW